MHQNLRTCSPQFGGALCGVSSGELVVRFIEGCRRGAWWRQHIASITEVGLFSMRVTTFYADEATALFVRTKIAARLVGGPLDNQYRAVLRNDRGEAEEFFTEDSATYRRVDDGSEVVDGRVDYKNLRFELVEM